MKAFVHKDLYNNAHNRFIHNTPKTGNSLTTKMRMSKLIRSNLLINKEEWITLVLKNTNFKNTLSERDFTHKSIHIIFSLYEAPEERKLKSQNSVCFSGDGDEIAWKRCERIFWTDCNVIFFILRGYINNEFIYLSKFSKWYT